jgi:hypothetical protein
VTYDFREFEKDCQAERRTAGPGCGVAKLYASITGDARGAVMAVIDNTEISARAIHTVLSKRMPDANVPTTWTIRHHRRGDCKCQT